MRSSQTLSRKQPEQSQSINILTTKCSEKASQDSVNNTKSVFLSLPTDPPAKDCRMLVLTSAATRQLLDHLKASGEANCGLQDPVAGARILSTIAA